MRFPAGTIRCERNPSLPVSPINSLPVFEKPRNEIPDLKNIDGGGIVFIEESRIAAFVTKSR